MVIFPKKTSILDSSFKLSQFKLTNTIDPYLSLKFANLKGFNLLNKELNLFTHKYINLELYYVKWAGTARRAWAARMPGFFYPWATGSS